MKNKKILILVASIMLIIICILFIILFIVKGSKSSGKVPDNVEMDKEVYTATNKIQEEKNVATYITADNCVKKYMDYILDENMEAIDSILTDEYKKDKNIDKTNIMDNINKIKKDEVFNTEKVYSYDSDFYFNIYIIKGRLIEKSTKLTYDCDFLLNIDGKNLTFKIAPLENGNNYINYADDSIENINIAILEKTTKEIESNEYNKADLAIGIGDKDVAKYYYNEYVFNMTYDTQKAYNLLNEEYKSKRFNNYNDYKKYLEQNQNSKSFIMKYKVEEFDNYKEYLCIDNLNNYYIFKETNPMEYTVILDQYSIGDKIYSEQYRTKDKKVKSQMLLNLVNQMVNTKDYDAIYDILDEDFKNKYFQNKEDLVKYIENNFFKYNEFKYSEVNESGNSTKIKTEITDCENSDNTNLKRFVVKMDKEKYTISFDI